MNARRIQPGESLLELAYEAGFDKWERIWGHEDNAEIRASRKDPQALLPGDPITIPERKTTPEEQCPVNKLHRFRLVRPRAWVNLRILDEQMDPLSGRRYRFQIGGRIHDGTTDDDGVLSVEIEPNLHRGYVWLWFDEAQAPFEAPVMVGHLDPGSSWSGLFGRLSNLGARGLVSPTLSMPPSDAPPDPFSKAIYDLHEPLTHQHDERD